MIVKNMEGVSRSRTGRELAENREGVNTGGVSREQGKQKALFIAATVIDKDQSE